MDFVKSGKHFYSVDFDKEFYLQKCIMRNREEDVVPFHKKLNFKKKEFSFEDSVFADYHCESDNGYHKDQEFWRLSSLLGRKQGELEELNRYLSNVANYTYIQHLHNFLRAWGGNVGYLEMEVVRMISKTCGLATDQNRMRVMGEVSVTDMDLFIKSAKFIDPKGEQKDKAVQLITNDKSIMRY